MDIEISCKSFEAEGSYSNNCITLQINDIDFGGNKDEVFKKILEEWYHVDNLPDSFPASEIVGVYDESELLDKIGDDSIADWTKDNVDVSNIEDYIDESVLKQYVRDVKIDSIVNK